MNMEHLREETAAAVTARNDMKIEVVVIPVSDVDRAKLFYANLGWRLDGDFSSGAEFRGIQFTPPGSSCSIHFGKGITSATPGSAHNYLVVSDIETTRNNLIARGLKVDELFHRAGPGQPEMDGKHPQRQSYSSFAVFKDPDGNEWLLQEVTARLPGRIEPGAIHFASESDLADAMRRAFEAHGEHEKRNGGHRDENWPDWYATHMVAEQTGKPLPV